MERLSAEQFARFQGLIYRHSGIRLDDRKVTLLTTRLQRRLRETTIESADQYYQWVSSPRGRDELTELLNVVTTNETSFFRTESHFDWFQKEFLEQMIIDNRNGTHPATLRIWSAACSIGAEPYSLAFCLADKRLRMVDWSIRILATDLCETSLQTARAGRFKKRMIDGVPPAKLNRYFRKTEGEVPEYEVRSEYAEWVAFRRHNLMSPLGERSFDCIFLRNVLIYFDEQSKQTVLTHMVTALAPGGYLVIGPSEGIYGLDNPLKKLSTFLYQKI